MAQIYIAACVTTVAGILVVGMLIRQMAHKRRRPDLLTLLLAGYRLRPVRRLIVPLAMTIGLSFALGEIWLVARFVAVNPEMADIPWSLFGGVHF